VVAHIISDKPQGKYNVKEEHFMSLCYAGHLPGYTMSQNHHGLVFSINTISAELLRSGKTRKCAGEPGKVGESSLKVGTLSPKNHGLSS